MSFRYRHGDRPLDGYTIQRGVGAGGFGEVYYAVSDGGRQVALKCLQHNQDIELRGVGQCMNLKSPYLVTIFDVKTGADGSGFVIMEYVTGPSLRDLMRDAPGGLGPEKAAFFAREISRGLGYLHERGIVHRDLKPENIFFEDGFVKIGDYGLSKYISVSRQSCQTISVGTVHYMAPEIGSGRYHRGIDIYALGIILYEMLTGRVPFTGDSFAEILMKHLTVEADLAPITSPFAGVLRKALAKNPDERYPRVEGMMEDFVRSPEVEAWLRDFRPDGISRNGKPEVGETVLLGPGVLGAGSPRIGPPPPSSPPASSPPAGGTGADGAGAGATAPPRAAAFSGPSAGAERKAPPEARAASIPSAPGTLDWKSPDVRQRVLFSLVTAVSMSVALGLLLDRGFSGALGSFLAILSGAFAILLVEREGPGRAVWEPGLPRRLLTVCVASPLYLFAVGLIGFRDHSRGSVIALIIATAVVGWRERIRSDRLERASLGQAFTAGLFAFLISWPLRGSPILAGGVLAAISLVVNVFSPYSRREPAGKRNLKAAARAAVERRMKAVQSAAFHGGHPAGQSTGPTTAPGPRPMRLWLRTFWWVWAAVFVATSLSLFIYAPLALRRDEEAAVGLSFAFATLGYAVFSARVGWSRYWPGFWRVSRWFLITTFLAGAAASGTCLAVVGLRDAEPALFTMIFSLVFALFLGLLPGRGAGKAGIAGGSGAGSREAPAAAPGWSALGALLVTLGILITLGSALFASGILEGAPREAQEFSQDFVRSRLHYLAGLAFFLPGLFCVLRSRQGLGATHVFRGAAGFSVMGLIVYQISRMVMEAIQSFPGGRLQFSQVGSENLALLFILGVIGALLLFWPAQVFHPEPE